MRLNALTTDECLARVENSAKNVSEFGQYRPI
jgi:hypothetical protein